MQHKVVLKYITLMPRRGQWKSMDETTHNTRAKDDACFSHLMCQTKKLLVPQHCNRLNTATHSRSRHDAMSRARAHLIRVSGSSDERVASLHGTRHPGGVAAPRPRGCGVSLLVRTVCVLERPTSQARRRNYGVLALALLRGQVRKGHSRTTRTSLVKSTSG